MVCLANIAKSRVVDDIDPDDLLRCSCCESWKAAKKFPTRCVSAAHAQRGSYIPRCATCQQIGNQLREKVNGVLVWPAKDKIRAALGMPVATPLVRAQHTTRKTQAAKDPEVQAALGVLRDARAQRTGVNGYIYCIAAKGDVYGVKIGYSCKPEARCGELQTGNPRALALLAKIEGTVEDERRMHEKYIEDNILGEWFIPTKELLREFGLKRLKGNA